MADLTVLYDGNCGLCRASAEKVRRLDTARRIDFVNLHDASVPERFPQIDRQVAMRWMQAVDRDGRVTSGAEAWSRIGGLLPGWNLIAWFIRVPGIRWLAGIVYDWIAGNRYRWNRAACADGTCSRHDPQN